MKKLVLVLALMFAGAAQAELVEQVNANTNGRVGNTSRIDVIETEVDQLQQDVAAITPYDPTALEAAVAALEARIDALELASFTLTSCDNGSTTQLFIESNGTELMLWTTNNGTPADGPYSLAEISYIWESHPGAGYGLIFAMNVYGSGFALGSNFLDHNGCVAELQSLGLVLQ